jgi:hypothetical protein
MSKAPGRSKQARTAARSAEVLSAAQNRFKQARAAARSAEAQI